ncbi:MAG: hypothetical protein RLZZ522_515 [Verrucomicrobiota bacterium]|jgi:hypothetical protein
MNELKEKLVSLGLSEDHATQAITAVAEFAKSKLPTQFHGMLDDVLAGKAPEIGGLGGMLGSLFGRGK